MRERRRQVGMTDGNDMRKTEATEASQATAVPEKYGPDAERQQVGREQQELQTSHELQNGSAADAEVKIMTQTQPIPARSEQIAIIVSTRPH